MWHLLSQRSFSQLQLNQAVQQQRRSCFRLLCFWLWRLLRFHTVGVRGGGDGEQRRHERRLRHQLPSVTLLDSLTPLPSLLNESLYSDQPAYCVRTRQQNFDEMIF